MSKVRSPNYPSLDLGAALAAVEPAYKAEHRNRMGRLPLAKHLGYTSLNGRALGKIGAVRAYGLIDGTGDEVRVSEDAIIALMAPAGSSEKKAALERLANRPSLFKEISAEFPTLPSEQNLSFWLVKKGYTPEASGKAANAYLATMRLVGDPSAAYKPGSDDEDPEDEEVETGADVTSQQTGRVSLQKEKDAPPPPGTRKAVFTLDEGDVTLTFPASLSSDGYQELKDYLDIFLRRAAKQTEAAKQTAEQDKIDKMLS